MRLEEAAYTIIDVETTGLYPRYGDRICEIGALRVEPDGSEKRFETLVDPGKPISPGAFAVNRITEEMLNGQPSIDEVLPDLMGFMDNSVLVAYNARFDMSFIAAAMGEDIARLEEFYVIDALKLARNLFPDIGRYNLRNVTASLGFNQEVEHRAMADVLATWMVFRKELRLLKEKGVEEIDEIARQYVRPLKDKETQATGSVETLIRESIANNKRLSITYRSVWNDKVSRRIVTPKVMRDSFLVAYCHLRKARRNFRIDCIVDAGICEPEK